MSAKKNQQNLNLSGFLPIQLNINSPTSVKSPAKDFGVSERILLGKEKIISNFDRWSLAQNNGEQCVTIIHNLKEKSRRSGDNPYPIELENYCKKLDVIKTVFEDVISSTAGFKKEIVGSISIFESLRDNEELKEKLITVAKFLDNLLKLYESSVKLKQFIVENIAHATSTHDSSLLVASWSCDSNQDRIFRLITQLKTSPPDHQWVIS